jgi:Xaa-Pro aminopeptidase
LSSPEATTHHTNTVASPPFDSELLDRFLDEAGVDCVLATSPHNVRYLLGGYRFFLYDRLDPIGPSRYLPVVGYVKGRAGEDFYIGAGNEDWGTGAHPLWVGSVQNASWSTTQSAELAAEALRRLGLERGRIGIEPAFLPVDAMATLTAALPAASFANVGLELDELRAVKSEEELQMMRAGANAVVESMLATFAAVDEGWSTREIVELFRQEQTRRGLTFDYCLIAAGSSINRAPSDLRLRPGDVLSLDSGADMNGYTADLTRMGILGEPTQRHQDLLGQVEAVQTAVRAVISAGRRGGDLFEVAAETIDGLQDGGSMSFLAHGTGLLTHEAPRLTATGSPPYPATHRDRPLQASSVLSVETHVIDSEVGFVKLEDTIIVGEETFEPVGDSGRGWNPIGAGR